MQIGEVIRKYRKDKNLTQEELANRLGVTPPAVSKWEKNNSMPDIMLLSPIARALDITLDTLLSFQENFTDEEVNILIRELNDRLKSSSYQEAFQWARKQIELYPNCEHLMLWMTQVLNAQCCIQSLPDSTEYETYICDCLCRVLNSKEEENRNSAADALFYLNLRNEEYEKAAEYLPYFSKQNPERKIKQALIYSKTDRLEEAHKAYEELLFSNCQLLNVILHSMYMLAVQENDMETAHMLVEKLAQTAALFDMGEYQVVSCRLELSVMEKDIDTTIDTTERMIEAVEDMCAFYKSPLYSHMTFRQPQEEFFQNVKKDLLENLKDEETFGFLKDNTRWKEMLKGK